MPVKNALKICILNGYPRASRDNFDLAGVGHPHDFFIDFLKRYVPQSIVDVLYVADAATSLPTGIGLASYDGYIWTGSDLTIYHEDDDRVIRQIELAREIYRVGIPSYGSCWGIQMAAVAAGGEVAKNPKGREWGVARRITLTADGRRSSLLKGKPDVYDGFIMHLDEVTRLPSGATVLATNEHTRVQALEVRHAEGLFWANQYHPEYNLQEMARLIAARAEPLVAEGFFDDTAQVGRHVSDMQALYDRPDSSELREKLAIGDDILKADIREQEMRNWLDFLVLPPKK